MTSRRPTQPYSVANTSEAYAASIHVPPDISVLSNSLSDLTFPSSTRTDTNRDSTSQGYDTEDSDEASDLATTDVSGQTVGEASLIKKDRLNLAMIKITANLRINRTLTQGMRDAVAQEIELWDGSHRMRNEDIRGLKKEKIELAKFLLHLHKVYHSSTERQSHVMILAYLVCSATDFVREKEDPKKCADDAGHVFSDLHRVWGRQVQQSTSSKAVYDRKDLANIDHVALALIAAGFRRENLNDAIRGSLAKVLVATHDGVWFDGTSVQTAETSASSTEMSSGHNEPTVSAVEDVTETITTLQLSERKTAIERPGEQAPTEPFPVKLFEPTDLEKNDLVDHPDWEVSVSEIPGCIVHILAEEPDFTARPLSVEGKFELWEDLRSRLAPHCALMLPEADNAKPWASMKHAILSHLGDVLAEDYRDLSALSPVAVREIATLVNKIYHREQRKQRLQNPHSAATKVATRMDQLMYRHQYRTN